MDRYIGFIIRLCAITAGFIAAAIVAGTSLALLTRIVTIQEAGQISDAGFGAGLAVAAFALASLTGYVAFIPSVVIILYSEFARRRDWLFYALCGGAIAAVAPLIMILIDSGTRTGGSQFFFMSIAAGMLGGIAYWMVAGRKAGNWLPKQF
ncbi:hypothetical protein [Hoeflea poritis]|uniref:Uncharacterized protein n=1 Tax=Hoeflea poritis TaxID=2993659 RepID=A0ABT4VLC8_9HYPH|nr:hypothetical protein [Hoeflea poritis]MDA4845511.1 hypothetical protein [Hoeflea poritis]